MGLGALIDAPAPELSVDLEQAYRYWYLMDGYRLPNLPVLDAMEPMADPEMMISLLCEIRDAQRAE